MITIVSGLPRSGTSMMMRMLEAGGMEVVIDNIRQADADNPKGYYEFEKAKKIKEDSSWIENMQGKVFKMVSMLLYHLPEDNRYNIIFMERKMEEMLFSQRRMLQRQNPDKADVDYDKMGQLYKKHLKEIECWLGMKENINVIFISYNDIIENPFEYIEKVNCFFGNGLDTEKMVKVLDRSLYRNRMDS